MKQKVKLIASDLDGTLLLNYGQELEPIVFDYIKRLKDAGIVFVASSGRQYANLQHLFEPVKDDIYYVCENGCLAICNNQMISHSTIERDLANTIIKDIVNDPHCEVLISGIHTSYVMPKTNEYYDHLTKVLKNHTTVVDDLFNIQEEPMKISLFETNGLDDTPKWKEKYGKYCTVQTGGGNWLDFMPKHVDKGYTLKKLLTYLDIDPKEVIAFGDNENDIQMLELVGCPITMENANPVMKHLGKYHTSYVPDSLERILTGIGYD